MALYRSGLSPDAIGDSNMRRRSCPLCEEQRPSSDDREVEQGKVSLTAFNLQLGCDRSTKHGSVAGEAWRPRASPCSKAGDAFLVCLLERQSSIRSISRQVSDQFFRKTLCPSTHHVESRR